MVFIPLCRVLVFQVIIAMQSIQHLRYAEVASVCLHGHHLPPRFCHSVEAAAEVHVSSVSITDHVNVETNHCRAVECSRITRVDLLCLNPLVYVCVTFLCTCNS
jgi:hypothetical protein